MTTRITVLRSEAVADGSFSVSGVFWLDPPANNVVPHPRFQSVVPNPDDAHLAMLRSGELVEEQFTTGLMPPATSVEEVRAILQEMFSESQAELSAASQQADIVGAQFDGTSWTMRTAPTQAWIAAQNPPKATDGSPLVAIAQRQTDGVPMFAVAPTVGSETVIASHNLCDKCTWFGDSIRVNDELLVDSGDGKTFNSFHTHWIDMSSGRMHNESKWVARQQAANPADPHGYSVIVSVNGTPASMREPLETSGGDYEVLYETGQVRFFSAPAAAPVVSYSYATTSTFYVQPDPGQVLRIIKAEVDVSVGSVMTDTVEYDIYALVDAVAPDLVAAGSVPSGTKIMVDQVVYKRMLQIVAEAQGAYPQVVALGASVEELAIPAVEEFRRTSRGMRNAVQGLPFNYETTRDLSSAIGAEVRVHTRHDRPFAGDTVTVAFYCISKPEA